MKKIYEAPEIEITKLLTCDILSSSSDLGDKDDGWSPWIPALFE